MSTKMSFEEVQTAMGELSIGLVEFDANGRVNRVDAMMQRLLGDDADTVLGRTTDECAAEVRPLLSGEPRSLRVEPGDTRLYRELVRSAGGGQTLVTIDLTEAERLAEENVRLRRQVEELTLNDDLTGLPNRRAISQSLDLHISRSRRYQNPLSVVFVNVDSGEGERPDDVTLLAVSRFLRDRLRWVDQVGRWDDTVFLALLPETNEVDARGLVAKIAGEEASMLLPDCSPDKRPRLGFGVACWSKGDDQRTLLRAASRDLGAEDD
jgi:diguanylate cyclase (GGDEF)-like protein